MQSRVKSVVMWAGIVCGAVGAYVGANGTAAIGGNVTLDKAIVWICGLVVILAAINNPTNREGI